MVDIRKQIPSLAFINAQVIQKAWNTDCFKECIRFVENGYGLQPGLYKYQNPAHVISLLYCLMVVPKEIWLQNENHSIYSQIDPLWLDSIFTYHIKDANFERQPAHHLIRHLRNAISHAHFAFTEQSVFRFWDQKKPNCPPNFEASASLNGLSEFISKVGVILANLKNE